MMATPMLRCWNSRGYITLFLPRCLPRDVLTSLNRWGMEDDGYITSAWPRNCTTWSVTIYWFDAGKVMPTNADAGLENVSWYIMIHDVNWKSSPYHILGFRSQSGRNFGANMQIFTPFKMKELILIHKIISSYSLWQFDACDIFKLQPNSELQLTTEMGFKIVTDWVGYRRNIHLFPIHRASRTLHAHYNSLSYASNNTQDWYKPVRKRWV
jgi:hypothetical protein